MQRPSLVPPLAEHHARFRSLNACPPHTRFGSAQHPRGFTLLEVLLAMTIIVIGLTAVIGVNVTALEALRASEDKVTAMMLLEGELVLLRSQSALQGGLNAGRWSGELEGFKDGQWTAEAVEETDSTALTLQGRWSRSGRIRSVSFITKTAAPPPESP